MTTELVPPVLTTLVPPAVETPLTPGRYIDVWGAAYHFLGFATHDRDDSEGDFFATARYDGPSISSVPPTMSLSKKGENFLYYLSDWSAPFVVIFEEEYPDNYLFMTEEYFRGKHENGLSRFTPCEAVVAETESE